MPTDDRAGTTDLRRLFTPQDFALVAKARARGGEAAAAKMIDRIARRVVATSKAIDERVANELLDDTDRCFPPQFLTRKV